MNKEPFRHVFFGDERAHFFSCAAMPVFANGSSAVTSTGFTGRLSSIACKAPDAFVFQRTDAHRARQMQSAVRIAHKIPFIEQPDNRAVTAAEALQNFICHVCVRAWGWKHRTRPKMMSAVAACSNVERNASTKWCGKAAHKADRIDEHNGLAAGSSTRAPWVQRRESLSSAKTPACVKRFIKVDLPAFV